MWTRTSNPPEDEEALLAESPTSTTSGIQEAMVVPFCAWRRLPVLITAALYRLLMFAIPSFLRRSHDLGSLRTSEKQPPIEAPKKFSTDYLDGVRGLASAVVFVFHWTHIQYPGVNSGYSAKQHSSIWQLPMIRFVYSGAAMVSIFFTVSGFVLTHRFIQKMHRGEFASLYSGLSSLTFRRALRLFLPAFASCMLAFVCASFGLITVPEKVGHQPFHHGVLALIQYVDRESDPWTWDTYMKGFYNPQLWSISLEYRGSMVVFLTVLALARSHTMVRLPVELGIVVHAFAHKRWDVALFIAGMLIAEVDVLVQESNRARAIVHRRSTKTVLILGMLIGVWLAGYPRDNGPKSLGYIWISHQWPHSGYRRRFWLGVGSILIVGPLPFLLRLQAFFNTRLIRYFGRISFALYLIHGLGNRTVGTWILRLTWQVLGKEGFWRRVSGYMVSSALYVPIIVWWSDMFWRAFDVPSTHFAKWIEGKCAARTAN